MTYRVRRGWWRLLALSAVALCVTLVAAPGAQAQWSEEYWFGQLDIAKSWQVSKGAGITVAVVDSGVPDTLGDIKGQLLPGADFSGEHTDGRSDPGAQCDQLGCYSHGLDMSLIIAGTGKGAGFMGIAPEAKIMPVKVQRKSEDNVPSQQVADGIRWAAEHGAKIINVSIGHGGPCDAVEGPAVKYAYEHGAIVVAGAGNDGAASVSSPANCPGALGVSATNGGPEHGPIPIWSGSNYGPQIAFTAIGIDMPQELTTGKKVTGANGTSQATAITSAVLALIWSHFPSYTARQVVTRALWAVHNGAGTDTIGTRINDKIGYGMILPYFALTGDVPQDFPNPIYDAWATQLGNPPGSPSGTSTPTSAPTSVPGQARASDPIAAPAPPRSGHSSLGSGAVTGIVVAAAIVVLIAGALVLQRRRSAASRR